MKSLFVQGTILTTQIIKIKVKPRLYEKWNIRVPLNLKGKQYFKGLPVAEQTLQ